MGVDNVSVHVVALTYNHAFLGLFTMVILSSQILVLMFNLVLRRRHQLI